MILLKKLRSDGFYLKDKISISSTTLISCSKILLSIVLVIIFALFGTRDVNSQCPNSNIVVPGIDTNCSGTPWVNNIGTFQRPVNPAGECSVTFGYSYRFCGSVFQLFICWVETTCDTNEWGYTMDDLLIACKQHVTSIHILNNVPPCDGINPILKVVFGKPYCMTEWYPSYDTTKFSNCNEADLIYRTESCDVLSPNQNTHCWTIYAVCWEPHPDPKIQEKLLRFEFLEMGPGTANWCPAAKEVQDYRLQNGGCVPFFIPCRPLCGSVDD